MPRIVLPTNDMIAEAAGRLRAGGVVAFPTETVYGLGADTFNESAIELIYQMKGRPFNNPLIAHVLDWVHAARLTQPIVNRQSAIVDRLTTQFWPGPLTLVLPKSDAVPARATAGLATIAVRAPAHPVARNLLQTLGGPISAPSANRSGHVSPTTARHVADDFESAGERASDLVILDGGPCEVGIESTVLDLTTPDQPRILRAGGITIEQLREILSAVEAPAITAQDASPGTAPAHYAPRTPAELVTTEQLRHRLAESRQPMVAITFYPEAVTPPHRVIAMPETPNEYARRIYGALREADALRCSKILIENPPLEGDLWSAIHDRLKRAVSA